MLSHLIAVSFVALQAAAQSLVVYDPMFDSDIDNGSDVA